VLFKNSFFYQYMIIFIVFINSLWRASHMEQIDLKTYYPRLKKLAWKYYYAYQCWQKNIDLDELFSVGLIALYDCQKNYKPEKNVLFWAYAKIHVNGKIIDFLNNNKLIHIPKKVQTNIKEYRSKYESFCKEHKREPSNAEMASRMGKPEKKIKEIQNANMQFIEINESESYKVVNYKNVAFDEYTKSSISHDVDNCMKQLPEEEEKIIMKVFFEGMTNVSIAEHLERSKNTITTKKIQALTRLKECLERKGWSIEDLF